VPKAVNRKSVQGKINYKLHETLHKFPKTKEHGPDEYCSPKELAFQYRKIPMQELGWARQEFISQLYKSLHPLALLKHKRVRNRLAFQQPLLN